MTSIIDKRINTYGCEKKQKEEFKTMNQKKRVVLTVCAAAAIVSLVPFRSLPSATMVKGQEMATALPETTPDAGATSTPVPTEIPATPAVPVKKLPCVKK